MTRALVLSGGGARGAFQVGVIHDLVENRGLDFDIFFGVSVGALNAAFMAQTSKANDPLANLQDQSKKLDRLWRNIDGNGDIYKKKAGFIGLALADDSLTDNEPLKKLLRANLDPEDLQNSGRKYWCGAVSLVDGKYYEFDQTDPEILDRIIASTAIPAFFPPVNTRDHVYVDGGVRNITPLGRVFEQQPDEIYVILTSRLIKDDNGRIPDSGVMPHERSKWKDDWTGFKVNGFKILMRAIDILTDEIHLSDIREALMWNEAVRTLKGVDQASLSGSAKARRKHLLMQRRAAKIHVIAPHIWWGKENDSTDFDRSLIRKYIRHGREIAADEQAWLVHEG